MKNDEKARFCAYCRFFRAGEGSVLCKGCMDEETEYAASFAMDCAKQYDKAREIVRTEYRKAGRPAAETESASHHIALRVMDNFTARILAGSTANKDAV